MSGIASVEWKNVLLFLFHGALMLGAAYAAAHADKYGWAVPALMTMASLSNAPQWGQPTPPDVPPTQKALNMGSGTSGLAVDPKYSGGAAGGLNKLGVVLLVGLLATGCSTMGGSAYKSPLGDISTFTVADLEAAMADATAHNDKAAMACYPVLMELVKSLPSKAPAAQPKGVVSAFQQARDLTKSVQSNASGQAVVAAVNLGCAALFNDVQGDILRLGVLFRP